VASYAEIRLLGDKKLKCPQAFAEVVEKEQDGIEEIVGRATSHRLHYHHHDYPAEERGDVTGGFYEDQWRRKVEN